MEAFTIEGHLCKILIVDDEILIRQGIKEARHELEQEGFSIVGEAANGREALEMIEACRPDIVITDIVMPVMDGEELTKVVKTRYPDIEVVVLSSFGEFEHARLTLQSGVADYILKPKLEPRELLQVLNKAAGRTRLRPNAAREAKASAAAAGNGCEKITAGFELGGEADRADIRASFPHPVFRLLAVTAKDISEQQPPRSNRWLEGGSRRRLPAVPGRPRSDGLSAERERGPANARAAGRSRRAMGGRIRPSRNAAHQPAL